jgi:hypothetical protein
MTVIIEGPAPDPRPVIAKAVEVEDPIPVAIPFEETKRGLFNWFRKK